MYENIGQLLAASPSLPGATSALPPGRGYSPEAQGSMNVPNALPTPVEFLDNYLVAGSPSFEIGVPDANLRFDQEDPAAQDRMNKALQSPNFQRRIKEMQGKYGHIIRGV
jgi:hypothetical protein